ncbi:MAG TPA: YaiI/YqxD family protein [Pseudomonadales bacterium]|nr:YaiI/YqxD family protein [Pseudomonadales bacterium]
MTMHESSNTEPRRATIWIDADALPLPMREMLLRAAQRTAIELVFVANHALNIQRLPNIRQVQVAGGFDVADDHIVGQIARGDLVITQDIPLAASCVEKGAEVITPRGDPLTSENVRGRLSVRNFMEEMRSIGEVRGGPPPLGPKEKQAFANALDKWLARNRR